MRGSPSVALDTDTRSVPLPSFNENAPWAISHRNVSHAAPVRKLWTVVLP